ncbi:MAG: hypothetical protein ACRC4L_02595 [Mycoplasma sp.]
MQNFKKIFKTTSGIIWTTIAAIGFTSTIAGAVMVPVSSKGKITIKQKHYVPGQDVTSQLTYGTGNSDWYQIYDSNGNALYSKDELKIQRTRMMIEWGVFEKYSLVVKLYEHNKSTIISLEKLLKEANITKKALEDAGDTSSISYLKVVKLIDEITISIFNTKETQKVYVSMTTHFLTNTWGIVLLSVGPVSLVASSAFLYVGYKKIKKEETKEAEVIKA